MVEEKTPRQRLKESLQKNAERVEQEWTPKMRSAISTARVFNVSAALQPSVPDANAKR